MTPQQLNASLTNLIDCNQLTRKATTEILNVMQQVELLTYISDSMKLEFCINILQNIHKEDHKHY